MTQTNADHQANFAKRKRDAGLTKWCAWIPADRVALIKQVVKHYSECDLANAHLIAAPDMYDELQRHCDECAERMGTVAGSTSCKRCETLAILNRTTGMGGT